MNSSEGSNALELLRLYYRLYGFHEFMSELRNSEMMVPMRSFIQSSFQYVTKPLHKYMIQMYTEIQYLRQF